MTFSLLNALAVALGNVFAGIAGRRIPIPLVLACASPVSLTVSVAFAGFGTLAWSAEGVTLGLIAGVTGGLGLLAAYRALAIGPVGMASAVLAAAATLVVAGAGFLFDRSGGPLTLFSLILCVIAIGLVSVDSRPAQIRFTALLYATLGGIGSGVFVIVMNTTDPADGWGPLVAVRIGVLGVAAVFLLATWSVIRREVPSSVPARWWLFAALAGAMDALGNVTLILALASLDLTTVAIVAATTPAIAAVIGWVALRERLRMTQQAGIALAVGAVILHQISR